MKPYLCTYSKWSLTGNTIIFVWPNEQSPQLSIMITSSITLSNLLHLGYDCQVTFWHSKHKRKSTSFLWSTVSHEQKRNSENGGDWSFCGKAVSLSDRRVFVDGIVDGQVLTIIMLHAAEHGTTSLVVNMITGHTNVRLRAWRYVLWFASKVKQDHKSFRKFWNSSFHWLTVQLTLCFGILVW